MFVLLNGYNGINTSEERMMSKYFLLAAIAWSSTAAVAKDNDLKVFVEYKHGPVHVHYALPCDYNATSSLASPKDSDKSWRVEITPTYTTNDIVSVRAVIKENDEVVSTSTVINKLGEDAKIVSASEDGAPYELTIRAYVNQK